jgi:hypothetical protein
MLILCFVDRAYYYEFKLNQQMHKLCRGDIIYSKTLLRPYWKSKKIWLLKQDMS